MAIVPTYPGIYFDKSPRPAEFPRAAATAITAFVGRTQDGPVGEPVSVHSDLDFAKQLGGLALSSAVGFAVRDFFGNGGTQASVVRLPSQAAQLDEVLFRDVVLPALERIEQFNLLCLPVLAAEPPATATALAAAAQYCASRRAVLLLDAPLSWRTPQQAHTELEAGRLGPASANAALYHPWLRMPNPLRRGLFEDFAPCGAVAGVMARTDATRGVWQAAAGTLATLSDVPQLSAALSDGDCGEFNRQGINCLRTLPGIGRAIWGARTRAGADELASEWQHLPVRRLALFIEESLRRGTRWAAFEENGFALWGRIRLAVGGFLHELFRRGAFRGTTPEESYFVLCDARTTTQRDIDQGVVRFQVGFAAMRPAEFLIVHIEQSTTPLASP